MTPLVYFTVARNCFIFISRWFYEYTLCQRLESSENTKLWSHSPLQEEINNHYYSDHPNNSPFHKTYIHLFLENLPISMIKEMFFKKYAKIFFKTKLSSNVFWRIRVAMNIYDSGIILSQNFPTKFYCKVDSHQNPYTLVHTVLPTRIFFNNNNWPYFVLVMVVNLL